MATAAGARRRLQALASRGWSAAAIGREELGISAAGAGLVLRGTAEAGTGLADRVAAACDLLGDRQPPQGTALQRAAVRAAQQRAAREGWPPPLAWDEDGEIDDPAADPAEGWRRSGRKTIPGAELVQDAEFVRQHGGHRELNARAMRLGVSRGRLEHAYIRAGNRRAETQTEAG